MKVFIVREVAEYEVEAQTEKEALAKFLGDQGIAIGKDIQSTDVIEREVYEA